MLLVKQQNIIDTFTEADIKAVKSQCGLRRADQGYRKIAAISKRLTEKGKLMVSGGGPGAMEATHLGAWMAGRPTAELDEAIAILAKDDGDDTSLWVKSAFEVIQKYPQEKYKSLQPTSLHPVSFL